MGRDATGTGPNTRPNGTTGGSDLPDSNKSTEPGYPLDGSMPGADAGALKSGFKPMGKIGGDTKSDPTNFE